MSKAGKLPGAFYGRICNIAHVSGLNAAPAVNAVAKEAINLVCPPSLLRVSPLCMPMMHATLHRDAPY